MQRIWIIKIIRSTVSVVLTATIQQIHDYYSRPCYCRLIFIISTVIVIYFSSPIQSFIGHFPFQMKLIARGPTNTASGVEKIVTLAFCLLKNFDVVNDSFYTYMWYYVPHIKFAVWYPMTANYRSTPAAWFYIRNTNGIIIVSYCSSGTRQIVATRNQLPLKFLTCPSVFVK